MFEGDSDTLQARLRPHLASVRKTIANSHARIIASGRAIRRVLEFAELTGADIERSRRLLTQAKGEGEAKTISPCPRYWF
jgi:hypothetical protein